MGHTEIRKIGILKISPPLNSRQFYEIYKFNRDYNCPWLPNQINESADFYSDELILANNVSIPDKEFVREWLIFLIKNLFVPWNINLNGSLNYTVERVYNEENSELMCRDTIIINNNHIMIVD